MKAFRIRNPKILQRVRSSWSISIDVLPQAVAYPKSLVASALWIFVGPSSLPFSPALASVVEKLQRRLLLVGSISLRLLEALFLWAYLCLAGVHNGS